MIRCRPRAIALALPGRFRNAGFVVPVCIPDLNALRQIALVE